MLLRDRTDYRESEAGARPGNPVRRILAPDEAVEDRRLQIIRDSDAVVCDLEEYGGSVGSRSDPDRATPRRVAYRVVHQVQDEPVQIVGNAVESSGRNDFVGELVVIRYRTELYHYVVRDQS